MMNNVAVEVERYSRQQDIVPAEKLEKCNITVIGVGAIGRQVALQLTAMGAPNLQFIDFDTIDESNIASQGYHYADKGQLKVEALSVDCKNINKDCNIETIASRFKRIHKTGNVVFCCVDSIPVRRFIWENVKDKVELFIDGRMAGEMMRILTVTQTGTTLYEPTLPGRVYEAPCTAKTTIYCANVVAGFMLAQFTKWLRGFVIYDYDIQLNLLSNELFVKR